MKKLIFTISMLTSAGTFAGIVNYPAVMTTKNPCNEKMLTVHGITTISINETSKGVFIYQNFAGIENGYAVNYHGESEFDKKVKNYDIETKGTWRSNENNFVSNAKSKILTTDGLSPSGDKVQQIENECD